MKQSTIASKLLTLLASGGTIERTVVDLPMFKTQIESTLETMKTVGRCSAAEIAERAAQLREHIRRKDEAIKHQDFDLAASMRAEECAVFESFRLEAPTGKTWQTILHVSIDEQTRQLSALLHDTNAT